MAVVRGNATVPSLPPPRPRSPPEYPDLYGKRRELAKVQMLEREIGFLQDELKSIEGLEPASRSCKEVADFITGNPDPLIPTATKRRRSYRFWKWLCGSSSSPSSSSCVNMSWICCCCGGCCPLKKPTCGCDKQTCNCGRCCDCSCDCDCNCCRMPKCCCNCVPSSSCCCRERPCKCPAVDCRPKCPKCCNLRCASSSSCCCFSLPKCRRPKLNRCSSCDISRCCCCCCYPCYSCY